MIDFSEIEAYYGPYAVEELDAVIAAVQNPDSTPDATHTDALITSAAVANALGARFISKTISPTTTESFSVTGHMSFLIAAASIGTARGLVFVTGTNWQNSGFSVTNIVEIPSTALVITPSTTNNSTTVSLQNKTNRYVYITILALAGDGQIAFV